MNDLYMDRRPCMVTQNNSNGKSKPQHSLFLFFLTGLFLLQIAFAFTIHGDIGPQADVVPGIERPASPVLVGQIDSIVNEASMRTALRVAPEAAFAPASRDFSIAAATNARIAAEASANNNVVTVQLCGDRFVEYRIKSGDTLEKISKKLYGNNQFLQSLIRLNRITDDRAIKQGELLKAPKAGLLNSIKIAESI